MAESDAPAAPPAPDPLTKDLPGLPIEFRNVRIDETGFHRKATRFRPEAHFAWEQVTAVRVSPFSLLVEYQADDRVRSVFHLRWTSRDFKPVRGAWKEYRLRALESRGTIQGAADCPVVHWLTWLLPMLGTAMLWLGLGAASDVIAWYSFFRFSQDPVERVLNILQLVVTLLAFAVGIWAVVKPIEMRRAMRRWRIWQFSKEGFVYWLRGRPCHVPPPKAVRTWFVGLGDEAIRVGGEMVLLGDGAVAYPVFLALNERAGRRARTRMVPLCIVVALLNLAAWYALAAVVAVFVAVKREIPIDLPVKIDLSLEPELVIYPCIITVISVGVCILVGRKTARVLTEGREMLKRLGW